MPTKALLGCRTHAVAIAAVTVLGLAPLTMSFARAQGSINLGSRGGVAGATAERTAPAADDTSNIFEFSARGGFVSDYIYRGTTLSDHRPAIGAAFELTALGILYAGTTFASVKLPSQPASEITMGGGIRPKLGDVTFDFGWTRYFYPGELPPPGTTAGIEYWETTARAETKVGELLRVAGGFAIRRMSQTPAPGANTQHRPGHRRSCQTVATRSLCVADILEQPLAEVSTRSEIGRPYVTLVYRHVCRKFWFALY